MANNQVEELEKKVKELQASCNAHEVEKELLKSQLSLKETMWTEKETILKAQIEQADQNMSDLRNQIANGSSIGMNIAELMAKLAIQQKRNSTLQIELKTSQLELTSKTQTDSGKTKLIELLDKKIEQLQGQNQRMLVQIENVAADRMRDAEGNKSSHSLIEQTMDRLKRADEINGKLQVANEQLRKMLDMMEEKTGKISTMAKEKLTLYKTENTKLQLTVQSLSLQLANLKSQSVGETPKESGEKSETAMVDAKAATAASEAITLALTESQKNVEMWKTKFEEIHEELEKLKATGERSDMVDNTTAAAESATRLAQLEMEKSHTNKALVKSREEVKRVLIEKMTVDEQSMMVEERQKEVKGRHEELLKQLAFTESAVRRLEYEIASVNEAVEAAEAQKEGAEAPQDDDSPLVLKIKNFIKEKMELKGILQGLDEQNIALRKDLETKEKAVEELNSEILDSQTHIVELKTMVSKSDLKEDRLGRIQSYAGQVTELQNALQKQSATVDMQLNTTSELESSKLAIECLQSKLTEYRTRYETLMEEKVVLESRCRDLETKLKTTKQTLKKADKENKKLLGERENLKTEVEDLQGELQSLTLANEKINAEMMELESTIMKSVEGKLTSLQINLEREQKGRKKLESDLENLRARHGENEMVLVQLQRKKHADEIESKKQLKIKQDELIIWKRENELLKNKIMAITAQYGESSTRDVTEREELKMDVDLLQCDLQKANDDLEGERANIADTKQLLMASFIKLLGVDHSNSIEKPSLKALATEMTDNLKHIQNQITEKSSELEEALACAESHGMTIQGLEAATVVNTAHQNELSAQLNTVTSEITHLKQQLSTSKSVTDQLESTLESVKKSSCSSQSKWEDEKKSLTKTIAELNAEVQGLLDKVSSQQQKLDQQGSEYTEIRASHEQLELTLGDLQQSSAIAMSELEVRKESLTSNITDLTRSATENIADIALLKETLDEKESQLRGAESARQELEVVLCELRDSTSSSHSDWLAEKESMTEKLEQQESALVKAFSTQKELESKLSDLRQITLESGTKWQEEKDSLAKQIVTLSDTIADKLNYIANLKEELAQKESHAHNLELESKETVGLHETLEKKEEEVMSLIETLCAKEVEYTSEKVALKQEVSALQFEISSQQMEHQHALQGLEGHASSIQDMVEKLAAQESLIEMLENDLELLKRERLLEKSRTLNELEELRQSLCGRDEECKLLNGELKRTSMLLDEERNLALRLKNELAEIQARYNRDTEQSRQEVKLLNTDIVVLKEQLIKIIKDKDVLWQKTDKLEYIQRLTVAGSWMDDTDTLQCLGCNATFSFLLRKHHCRLCGRIFCYSCCNQWVKTPNNSKKTRICTDCAAYHKSEVHRDMAGEEDSEEDSPSVKSDARPSKSASESARRGTGALDDVRRRLDDDVTEEDKAPSTFRPDEESEEEFLTSPREDSKIVVAGSLQTAQELGVSPAFDVTLDSTEGNPVGAMATNLAKVRDSPRMAQHLPKAKKSQSETDQNAEYYDVITEEEIVQSLQEAIFETDAHTLTSPMLTVELIAAGHGLGDPHICIRPGKAYVVPVFIDAPGVVLCWEFSTEPKGIHFSVTLRRDALTSHDLAEMLIPLCPCNSHHAAVQGELIAMQPGLYTLIFDNSTSRFTSKKLTYHLHVKRPEAAD